MEKNLTFILELAFYIVSYSILCKLLCHWPINISVLYKITCKSCYIGNSLWTWPLNPLSTLIYFKTESKVPLVWVAHLARKKHRIFTCWGKYSPGLARPLGELLVALTMPNSLCPLIRLCIHLTFPEVKRHLNSRPTICHFKILLETLHISFKDFENTNFSQYDVNGRQRASPGK